MPCPPAIPAEGKVCAVLSILAGGVSVAEAGRRAKVGETAVGNGKRALLDGGVGPGRARATRYYAHRPNVAITPRHQRKHDYAMTLGAALTRELGPPGTSSPLA